ncbi:MAG: hypothetical protein ACT4OJ_11055 [Bacteroidota bacterium]
MSTEINEALGISPSSGQPANPLAEGKYSSLKKTAGIMTVLAWIAGVIILIVGLLLLDNASKKSSYYGQEKGASLQAILIFFAYLFLAVLSVVSLLVQAGVAKVLVDIEENTRKKDSK